MITPLLSQYEINALPLFEIVEGQKIYRIWANGKVEGFDPSGVFIINRAIALIFTAEARHLLGTTSQNNPQIAIPSGDPAFRKDAHHDP